MKVPYVNFPAQFAESQTETMSAIQKVFEKGEFILGSQVEAFEKEFAEISNVKHAVAVANGTDSLIIALKHYGIGTGDEVITASNSWISSASSIALVGATPVFVDVADDQNIDPSLIEAAITPRTKAIMPVHLTGRCAPMTEIMAIAEKHKLVVIEDAAQAVCAKVDKYTAGNAGHVASFSLHPLKNLNAFGDAGILTTNDDEVAKSFRLWRNHGLKNRDEIIQWGYNSRLDAVQAAVLRTRLPRLDSWIEKRRKNAQQYFQQLEGLVQLPYEKKNEKHTYHVFVVQCDKRDELKNYLEAEGVETKIHYPIPIHMQEAARALGYKKGSLPKTELQAQRILSLPVNQYLTEDQIDYICGKIKKFYS